VRRDGSRAPEHSSASAQLELGSLVAHVVAIVHPFAVRIPYLLVLTLFSSHLWRPLALTARLIPCTHVPFFRRCSMSLMPLVTCMYQLTDL